MNQTYETKKTGADKIALLGLFALALLLAHLMVASRSAVKLSEPMQLEHTGLSVSMPTGSGWQSEKRFSHKDNCLTVSSLLTSGHGEIITLASCRYSLAPVELAGENWLRQEALQTKADIVNQGEIHSPQPAGELTFHWEHLRKQQGLHDCFLAAAELPNGRRLDIELHQFTGEAEPAEKTFRKIMQSVEFNDVGLLARGAEIIAEIKRAGPDSLLMRDKKEFFLIKDPARHTLGFAMELLTNSAEPALTKEPNGFDIQAASYYYIRGGLPSERLALFQGEAGLGRFIWKSEITSAAGRMGNKTSLDENGIMTVYKLAGRSRQQKYRPGPASIPEPFLELVLTEMLEGGYEEIIVDIIEHNGTIAPVLISALPGETAESSDAHAFQLQLLDGRGFSQRLYLNEQMRVSRALLQQEKTYLLERTTAEEVLRLFPERADYILQKNSLLR